MRNTFFIILLLVLNIPLLGQEAGNSSPITIREKAIKVGDLLAEITRQSGADFTYNSLVVDSEATISFKIRKASLEETLNLLSEKIQVAYSIVEGQIILNFEKKVEPPKYFTLSGFLADQSSGENLISATVSINDSGQGVFTNEFGYYALTLPEGVYTINSSYLGYEDTQTKVTLDRDIKKNLVLPPAAIGLPAVIVRPPLEDIQNKKQLGTVSLSPDELNNLPEFAGESGLIKGLQTLPGIKMHSDGSSFFFTRGGERDQNLLIIDDAPIYNPSHMLGFYSLVIPDFAKDIQIYKSDMPASVGDRLSSIVSIRTKDGNLNKGQFSGALNSFVNRLSIETPLVKQRSSIFLSVRRSNYEWLYKNNDQNVDLYFQDFQFKWNYKVNQRNRLFFTAIQSGDVFENKSGPLAGIRWGNLASTFRWNHIFSSRLFANTTFYTGNYAYTLQVAPNYWKSQLSTFSFKTDFTYYTNSNSTANFGLEMQAYFNNPGSISFDPSVDILPEITNNYSRKTAFYYQGSHRLSDKLKLNTGARVIIWNNLGPKTYFRFDENYIVSDTVNAKAGLYNSFVNADPRLSLQYSLDSTSQLKLSFGTYHQYLQLISNSVSPFTAFEVWLPASPNIQPQFAAQWAVNYLKYFPAANMEISAAAYYKKFRHQIDYEPYSTPYLNPLLEGELRFGTAQAYGLELLLKRDFGRLNGWISYTYSRVFRQTEGINDGLTYRAFQDRPHDFSIVLNYQLRERIRFTANWISQSGSTFTSPTGFYTFNEQTVPIYGERNNDRLPTYHRLDVSWQFVLNRKPDNKYQHSLIFSIYNALAHKNVFAVKFNKLLQDEYNPQVGANVLSDQQLSPSQIDLVRFFPSLTYKFKL